MEKKSVSSIVTISGSTDQLVPISTRKRVWEQKKKKLVFASIPILGACSLLFLGLFIAIKIRYNRLQELRSDICTSEHCIDTAKNLLDTMDRSKDPCVDFYGYSCGNFGKEHPIPDGSVYRSWFEEGEEKLSRMVQIVLDEIVNNTSANHAFLKIHDYYKSCTDVETLEELGLEPLFNLLALNGLPKFPSKETAEQSFNLGKTMGQLQRNLNMDVIVQLSFSKGEIRPGESNDTYILQISPASQQISRLSSNIPTPLSVDAETPMAIRRDPSTFEKASAMAPHEAQLHRIKFMTQIMRIMQDYASEGSNGEGQKNDTELIGIALEILTFSSNLNKEMLKNKKDNDTAGDEDELMTFASLQNTLEQLKALGSGGSGNGNQIIWNDYLDGLFGNDSGYWAYDYHLDVISVNSIESFKELATFLGVHQAEDIQRYVWWVVVSEYARFTTEEVESAYRKLHEAVIGKAGGSSRSRICVGYVRKLFPLVLAKEIKNFFGLSEDTKMVAEMLDDIVNEFESLVEEIEWMDRHTKQLNIEKAKAVKNVIGYEDAVLNQREINEYYKELEIDSNQFLKNMAAYQGWQLNKAIRLLKQTNDSLTGALADVTNPLQVNAYYARTSNAVYVPAGILQRPFYLRGLECLNYGAIGSILGHELTHGFDNDGKNYDRDGKVRNQIWSPEITQKFNEKAQCFVEQYGAFNLTKELKVDGKLTLAENIADNGGIRESYYAYQTYLKRHGPEHKLPGFEDFSPEKLLFLSFATIWCEASTERYRELAAEDNHSPNRVRVIAALQNMKEFSLAFQCPPNTLMNPKKKCVLW